MTDTTQAAAHFALAGTQGRLARRVLYKPTDGYFGDVNPIFAEGRFHLPYIFCVADDDDSLNGGWRGIDWAHVVTDDFATFETLPLMIERGGPDDPDALAGAGSVIERGPGDYVAFYAGINPEPLPGRPEQVILRATSSDLVTWTKDPDFVLEADERWYERNCLRDPFVYRHGDGWRMLLAAQVHGGPVHRRGAIGLAASDDLDHWTFQEPLLSPGTTLTPECPETFVDGDRHYLVYSTYSDRFATRYRVGAGPDGPWVAPADDALESADIYAAKTVSDGHHRYLIGWLATRAGDRDTGNRQWGGVLVAHRLETRDDGSLGEHMPEALADRFDLAQATFDPRVGDWDVADGSATFRGAGFGWASLGSLDETCLLEVDIDVHDQAEEVGIGLRSDSTFDQVYVIRLEPKHGRVVFDRRPHEIIIPFDPDGDRAYVTERDFEIERPLHVVDGKAHVRVLLDGSAIVAYINDVALSTRGYGRRTGEWGVFAAAGLASFSNPRFGRLR